MYERTLNPGLSVNRLVRFIFQSLSSTFLFYSIPSLSSNKQAIHYTNIYSYNTSSTLIIQVIQHRIEHNFSLLPHVLVPMRLYPSSSLHIPTNLSQARLQHRNPLRMPRHEHRQEVRPSQDLQRLQATINLHALRFAHHASNHRVQLALHARQTQ